MRRKNQSPLFLVVALIAANGAFMSCSFSFSYNNRWKVPNSNLSVSIERKKSEKDSKTFRRTVIFEENFSTKNKIEMSPENGDYSRSNVYKTSDKTYLIKDFWNGYEVNTETKTLQKIDSVSSAAGEFIGAFDLNENGSWSFIPAAERNEIPLGKVNQNL